MTGTTYPHAAGLRRRRPAADRHVALPVRRRVHARSATSPPAATRVCRPRSAKTPADVHDEVKNATVLGRGGAGFPAGIKWGLTPQAVWPRYLVVNGDESEPGTYKDRLLMELRSAPADRGLPDRLLRRRRCRSASSTSAARWRSPRSASPQALNEAYAAGYVGKNILGTDFSVDIVLHWGAGAYVVGEETALIESLEGNRGMPRLKPPYFPAAIGLYGKPTIVNNVETLANLPWLHAQRRRRRTPRSAPRRRPARAWSRCPGTSSGPACSRSSTAPRRSATCSTATSSAAASATATSSRRSCPAAARRRGSCPTSSTCRSKAKLVGAAGSMLGSGAIMVMDDTTDIPAAALHARALLRPRVVRQVRAVPRGRHLAGADPEAHRRRPRHRRATSTSCSRSASRSAPATSRTRPASGSASRPCRSRTR